MSTTSRPLKLGFLLFDYFPFGGLQRDCLAIARLCVERGHAATIFTQSWTGEKPSAVQIELFGHHGLTNTLRNRNWLRWVQSVLPAHQLDGVVGFNRLPGLDVYYGADPCFVAKVRRTKSRWHRLLPRYRQFAEFERAVFARGSTTELLLLTAREIPVYQEIYGTEPERFHLLPPNATRRSFTPEQQQATRRRLRTAQGWAAEEEIVLFVGSDFRRKGLERALHALAAIPSGLTRRHLVVIGDCSPGRFGALARTLGVTDRVHFLGGRHDAPDWMLAADVLIHPAHTETAGIVLLEALTFGLPVLTTEACGYAPHVAAAGGLVLPAPFRQESCNTALAELLQPEVNAARRVRALDYAAREDLYSCHQRVAEWIEITVEKKADAVGHIQAE